MRKMKQSVTAVIQTAQMTYLMRFRQPCLGALSLTANRHSCRPPIGQIQPQKRRPRNGEVMNIAAKTIKLPVIMPSDAPCMIR